MINGNQKIIVPHAKNQPDSPIELYDLTADPFEVTNLASDKAELVKSMTAQLDAWWTP
jgi:hypothetical protein